MIFYGGILSKAIDINETTVLLDKFKPYPMSYLIGYWKLD